MPGYATPSPDTNQTAHRSSHEPDDAAKSAGGAGPCPKSGVAASFRSSATHDRSDSLDPDQSTRRYEKCGLGFQLGVPIDLTIFTPTEFSSAPLRDMPTLVMLYNRCSFG